LAGVPASLAVPRWSMAVLLLLRIGTKTLRRVRNKLCIPSGA